MDNWCLVSAQTLNGGSFYQGWGELCPDYRTCLLKAAIKKPRFLSGLDAVWEAVLPTCNAGLAITRLLSLSHHLIDIQVEALAARGKVFQRFY